VEEPKPIVRPEHATAAPTEIQGGRIQAPRLIPRDPWIPSTPEPAGNFDATSLIADGGGSGGPGVFPGTGVRPNIVRGPVGPKTIPSVLAEGLLIHKVIPRYPPIGIATHQEGTVVLQAMISKSGMIENLRVVGGPALLQQAALDAVQQWRYRPYLLNGQPVEVETTINVEFKLQ
jgi:periplasmic protein TonB